MKVSLVQMNSIDSWDENLQWILRLLSDDQFTSRDLICFPENSLYMRVKENDSIDFKPLSWSGYLELAEVAKKIQSNLHLGSVGLQIDGQNYNASVYIQKDGHIFSSYQKIHLFDIHLEGKSPIRESDLYARGEGPQVLSHEDWKIGQSICYDLRFSELYSRYAEQDVDIILIPAAFLVPTGIAHWDILVRARAIESQCYVLASCQAGVHESRRHVGAQRLTYGNSMIVSPWGDVVSRLESGTGAIHAELSKEAIRKVRQQIPMKNHRRLK